MQVRSFERFSDADVSAGAMSHAGAARACRSARSPATVASAARQSACLRRNAGMSNSSTPECFSASTVAAIAPHDRRRLVEHRVIDVAGSRAGALSVPVFTTLNGLGCWRLTAAPSPVATMVTRSASCQLIVEHGSDDHRGALGGERADRVHHLVHLLHLQRALARRDVHQHAARVADVDVLEQRARDRLLGRHARAVEPGGARPSPSSPCPFPTSPCARRRSRR